MMHPLSGQQLSNRSLVLVFVAVLDLACRLLDSVKILVGVGS